MKYTLGLSSIIIGFIIPILTACPMELPLTLGADYDDLPGQGRWVFRFNETGEEYLSMMDEEFNISDIVETAETDLERIQKITGWAHGLWTHDGSNQAGTADPAEIIRRGTAGEHFRCVEYGIVAAVAGTVLGFPVRVLGLRTKDVEYRSSGAGHVAAEIYSLELKKWIFTDPQWNAVPLLNGKPLSAVEFKDALWKTPEEVEFPGFSSDERWAYIDWISDYLYFFTCALDNRIGTAIPGKSSESLTLCPLGEKKPTYFQGSYLPATYYTRALRDFYPAF